MALAEIMLSLILKSKWYKLSRRGGCEHNVIIEIIVKIVINAMGKHFARFE